MELNTQNLLSISEFSKLCNTTRKNLIYYDQIHILPCHYRNEHGYRYYLISQVNDFLMIQLLKQANCSLEEIRNFFTSPNAHQDTNFLKEKAAYLNHEKEKMENYISQISQMIDFVECFLPQVSTIPQVISCNVDKYFFLTPIATPISLGEQELSFKELLYEHIDKVKSNIQLVPFPISLIVSYTSLKEQNPIFTHIGNRFATKPKNLSEPTVAFLPSGTYLSCKCNCTLTAINSMLHEMYQLAQTDHLEITGDFILHGSTFDFNYENPGFCVGMIPVKTH